jgi:quercetin dioxygenase-like cupin family protein
MYKIIRRNPMKPVNKVLAAASVIVVLGTIGIAVAQAPGLTRTVVTTADVSVPNREAVVARVEIAPGGVAGWHTHPGDEISYVTDGELTLMLAGQAPRKVAAGQGFVIPAGTVHSAKNDGAMATKLVGVYVVEKGKPLATPAPAPM